mmetsp:Transcript_68764/g.199124  ORF Transcript_68764/g.199124 Transcript_68764/m.199124 type:complete len:216 (-) Transcript_68764:125-772(-)
MIDAGATTKEPASVDMEASTAGWARQHTRYLPARVTRMALYVCASLRSHVAAAASTVGYEPDGKDTAISISVSLKIRWTTWSRLNMFNSSSGQSAHVTPPSVKRQPSSKPCADAKVRTIALSASPPGSSASAVILPALPPICDGAVGFGPSMLSSCADSDVHALPSAITRIRLVVVNCQPSSTNGPRMDAYKLQDWPEAGPATRRLPKANQVWRL